LSALLVPFLIAFAALCWIDCMRARETATDACARACTAYHVQFLDSTVALASISLRRSGPAVRLKRRYRFAFSETGYDRKYGEVVLLGREVEAIYLAPT
jgi:hypothetical protein